MSRYRVSASAPADTSNRTVVDATVIEHFCRDDDGCEVVLLYDLTGYRTVARTRLLISTNAVTWSESNSGKIVPDQSVDDDVLKIVVLGDGSSCNFSDRDLGGVDNAPGFTLAALAANSAISCTLTLID